MSLVGTLAKVAIGIAVAKGVSGMIQKGSGTGNTGTAGGGDPFGRPHSPSGGGLGDMMGEVLGGRAPSQGRSVRPGEGTIFGGSGGGIGDLLEELGGHARGGAGSGMGSSVPSARDGSRTGSPTGGQRGGLDELIEQIGGSKGGGLGDLLGGLLGGLAGAGAGSAPQGRGGSFGEILNQSFGNRGEPDVPPSRDQDAAAALMLKAMIQAAKSDGRIDAEEERKLLGNLGDVSPAERRFVEAELRAPINVAGLANQVPRGLGPQVYTMSLMAIDLDNRNEAEYLHKLAVALGLDRAQVNRIHARLGAPALYA